MRVFLQARMQKEWESLNSRKVKYPNYLYARIHKLYILENIMAISILLKIKSRLRIGSSSGAAEPNAQGCAFVHPIFDPIVNRMMALRSQNLGFNYELRTQY